jgi:hypothetical protein
VPKMLQLLRMSSRHSPMSASSGARLIQDLRSV